ncbi:hypothetical protein ACOSQ2_030736 [Xanthoceras sorbifolium]
MGRSLFLHITNEVERHDNYFVQRRDGLGRLGLLSLQKITAVFRMLAYGVPADSTDEYIKIGESTSIESMKRFCRAVVEVFGERHLRSPNAYDVARNARESRLYALEMEKLSNGLGRTIQRTLPGSNNDINVLKASHLFSNLAEGIAPPAYYVIQGKEYSTRYYLADGIYPKWSTLVQTIHDLRGPQKKNKHVLHDIMSACIIMHNMIGEDERDVYADIDNWREAPAPEFDMAVDENTRFQQFLTRHREIRDKEAHIALRNALIEHLWEQYSNSPNY